MALLRSLRARVLLWVSVALTVLFALTVGALDITFSRTTETARRELLDVQLLGLIGVAELDADGAMAARADAFNPSPESGQYAAIWDADGRMLWGSGSLLNRDLLIKPSPEPFGEPRYVRYETAELGPLEMLLRGIQWELDDGVEQAYTFGVAVSLEPYFERQNAFRRYLIAWFATITALTLLVLSGLLRVVLRPLRTLEQQVREVEGGRRQRLSGEFPAELTPLAGNLNALIETERWRLVRYRNMLDDLAHSLKTPLAAMRSLLSELGIAGESGAAASGEAAASMSREVERMDQRVSYQLRRARASGATGLGAQPVEVQPVIEDLRLTLDKVYRDKAVTCTYDGAARAAFHGDPGDLTELLGNLLENAYKYCRSRVHVGVETRPDRLVFVIGDDGPGVDEEEAERLLERGVRADESTSGQGIGLAVVRETVELYGGTLSVGRSPLGGAEVRVELGRAGYAG